MDDASATDLASKAAKPEEEAPPPPARSPSRELDAAHTGRRAAAATPSRVKKAAKAPSASAPTPIGKKAKKPAVRPRRSEEYYSPLASGELTVLGHAPMGDSERCRGCGHWMDYACDDIFVCMNC